MNSLRDNKITIVSFVIAVLAWFGESLVHYFFLDIGSEFKIVPDDFNELWMRFTIVVMIIMFGLYANHQVRIIRQIEAQKLRIIQATLRTVHDIVGNAFNTLVMNRMELEDGQTTKEQSWDEFNDIFMSALRKLNRLSDPSKIEERKIGPGLHYYHITETSTEQDLVESSVEADK